LDEDDDCSKLLNHYENLTFYKKFSIMFSASRKKFASGKHFAF